MARLASPKMQPTSARRIRLLASVAAAALISVAAAGCQTITASSDVTGSIKPRGESDWRRQAEVAGERYRANPKDSNAALQYAQALRETDQKTQAVAVLEQASIASPSNTALLAAYGRALADVGNFQQAFDVLNKAHTPDNPDWRILSVQGASLDQMGKHEEARRYYASALKIVPEEPSVLSNLGLSYALSKDLRNAETTLRRAIAKGGTDARVRQNLALVVGLQGRFAEAEQLAQADLPAEEAAANVAYLRDMLNREGQPNARKPARSAAVPAQRRI